jgi:pimeloyl-ACP methyl ester carboxylesterase
MSAFDDTARLEHLRRAAGVAGLEVERFVLPEEHDALIGRIRIHYLDWGNPDLPPILLLHGGGLTAHTWDLPCVALRARFRCIAPDLRGHGDSEWSPELAYRLADHAADAIGLADHLGLERFALVGMSLGGLAALAVAGRHPDRLASLTIIDAGTEIRMDSARRIRRFMTGVTEFATIDEVVERAMGFNPRRDPELLRFSLLHNLRRLPDGVWTWKHDSRHRNEAEFLADLSAEAAALTADLGRVECPVLVIRGGESDAFLDEDARRLAARFPDGRVAGVAGAGHTVQGDNPAGLVEVLEAFIGAR